MTETGVSRTLALAWGLAAAPQRGPKRELSLERIVDAAIEIADAEGLAAVTMQRVAKTFDFSTMALYRYVATKDDLHQLMLDRAMSASIERLSAHDWQAGLRDIMRGLVLAYRRHAWALDIALFPEIHLMPGEIHIADQALRAMRELNVAFPVKLGMLMLASSFARGHAGVEREVLAGVRVSDETRELLEEAVTLAEFPEAARLVRSGEYFGDVANSVSAVTSEEEADQALDFALEVLISGLEVMLTQLPESAEGAEGVGSGAASASGSAPAPEPTPREAYEIAEAELRAHKDLRKRTQQRVRELERQEAALQKARDRAKELAKAHEKLARG